MKQKSLFVCSTTRKVPQCCRPTTACTRLGYAAPSRGFAQFQRVFPAKESLLHRRAGEANRLGIFGGNVLSKILTESKSKIVVAVGASLVALATSGIQLYQETFGTHSVVIASSPSDAQVKVNGKDAGKAPLTIELKRGTYTIEAVQPGYEPAQHAIYVSPRDPNLVNIQLLPLQSQTKASAGSATVGSVPASIDSSRLLAEVEKLKAALMSNPEEALSLPLIREKMRVQEELSKALRDDLKEVKEQTKWYLGSMIAIVVGLLAVIATLFVGQRSKPNA